MIHIPPGSSTFYDWCPWKLCNVNSPEILLSTRLNWDGRMQNSVSNPLEISTKFKNPGNCYVFSHTPWKMERILVLKFCFHFQTTWNLLKLLLIPWKIPFIHFTPWNFPMLKRPGNFLFFSYERRKTGVCFDTAHDLVLIFVFKPIQIKEF